MTDRGNVLPCGAVRCPVSPETLADAGATILEASAVDVLYTSEPQCEDCPDVNPSPPKDSLCENFDTSNGFPVCIRDGNSDDAIHKWMQG